KIERAGVEGRPAGEPRRGGEHARDIDCGGGHAAVERSSGVRVLVLVGNADAHAVERDRLHHDTEPGAVGRLGDACGEGGEQVSHRRPPIAVAGSCATGAAWRTCTPSLAWWRSRWPPTRRAWVCAAAPPVRAPTGHAAATRRSGPA